MTKEFYDDVYKQGHASNYGGGEAGIPERVGLLLCQTDSWLERVGLKERKEAKILEIGCGMAFLSNVHPGWCGAEYSRTAVERVKVRDGVHTQIFEEDAQRLSFPDESFDGVFTFAALEHVPDPDRAFREIDRILRGGGYGLIAPAWNCRSWTVKKLLQRSWRELSIFEKIQRCSIPLREHIAFRALVALPKRFWTELEMFLLSRKRLPLRFRALRPRWDLIEKYGHVSDDDAVADIDPHAGIAFFRSRGYEILSHQSLLARLLARHEAVVVRKPFQFEFNKK